MSKALIGPEPRFRKKRIGKAAVEVSPLTRLVEEQPTSDAEPTARRFVRHC